MSPGVGETRLCRMRVPLTKPLNWAKVVVVAATLVHYIDTMVMVEAAMGVGVELASVTDQL